MYLLFETGQLEEARFVAELRSIGCEVHDVNENGEQFAVEAFGGHFSGHMDGCALGVPEAPKTWHVLEFKTHNAKSFAKLKKEGVEKAKPQHYAQMQAYMGLTNMTRALYIAKDKNDDSLYSERVRFDKDYFAQLMDRARRIIFDTSIPDRISEREDYYECGWCAAHQLCWGCPGPALPVASINCRQCCHATPETDGIAAWSCAKHGRGLSAEDQGKACGDHLCLPGLIVCHEPSDASDCWIEFRDDSGKTWLHGAREGGFSTKELMQLPFDQLLNPLVTAAKHELSAVAIGCSDDILSRYDDDLCHIAWTGKKEDFLKEWKNLYADTYDHSRAIQTCCNLDYIAAEFPNAIVVVEWRNKVNTMEIRELIPF
jgi:hypothetical protein